MKKKGAIRTQRGEHQQREHPKDRIQKVFPTEKQEKKETLTTPAPLGQHPIAHGAPAANTVRLYRQQPRLN